MLRLRGAHWSTANPFTALQGHPRPLHLGEAMVAIMRPRSTTMYTTMRQYAGITPHRVRIGHEH